MRKEGELINKELLAMLMIMMIISNGIIKVSEIPDVNLRRHLKTHFRIEIILSVEAFELRLVWACWTLSILESR